MDIVEIVIGIIIGWFIFAVSFNIAEYFSKRGYKGRSYEEIYAQVVEEAMRKGEARRNNFLDDNDDI